MARSREDVELDECIRRLKKLKAKFPEEGSNAVAGSGVDGFAELEETFLRRVANATELLKNMSANSDTVSVTEQIRARTNAHAEITAISETVRKMSELIMKEYKLKAKSKGKLSDDELLRRDQNVKVFTIKLNQLSQQLMQGRQGARNQLFESFVPKTTLDRDALFGSGNGGGGGAGNLGAAAASRAGVGMSDPGGEAMSAEQQQALAEIYRRDEEQDKMIEEIGELIQETGQLAQQIGDTVAIQAQMLAEVEKSMDIAHDKVADVNTRLKRTLEAKGMSWERMCMVFLCMALILGLIGVIIPKGSTSG